MRKVLLSQKKFGLILPRISIVRLVRDYLQLNYQRKSFRVQSKACEPIQIALEATLLEIVQVAGEIMLSAKRITLHLTDLKKACLIGKYTVGIMYAPSRDEEDPWLPTENLLKISENALKRITTRAGVLRASSNAAYFLLELIDRFVINVMQKTVPLVEQAKLRTIRKKDVLLGIRYAGGGTTYC